SSCLSKLASSLIQLCSIPLCSVFPVDFSHILLLKMLDLMTTAAGENEVLPDLDEAHRVRSEVVRQLPLSQRERKAGCQNLFWKTTC
uniref:Somatostatin/Cortistatin C-terminal domain-containing protein n=1 Tax=Salmo trutta TaxID=8032 RepID=A0A674BE55_SALTR